MRGKNPGEKPQPGMGRASAGGVREEIAAKPTVRLRRASCNCDVPTARREAEPKVTEEENMKTLRILALALLIGVAGQLVLPVIAHASRRPHCIAVPVAGKPGTYVVQCTTTRP